VDVGIDVCFLVGWGCAVIARVPMPAAGSRSWMASGANRTPSRERTSLMTRSC